MYCPNCQTDNPTGARFCQECGAVLPRRCPNCGAALPVDAHFCPSCGHPVPQERPALAQAQAADQAPALVGERRVITALLADVKGSTALAERIDTEAWVEIMNRVFHILGAEIYRYGGKVDQFRGDGLVAFFGVPTVHEDDPERALLAALAMQEAVQRYAAELDEKQDVELLLRVGVNTGEVIAAQVGERSRHSEDTAMGRAIALAARMETAAEPGTVLVSENTYRLVAPLFEWQSLGEITVKGVSQPVAVYRLLAHRGAAGKVRGIEGLESPLVGRAAEFSALQAAVQRLQEGIGGIVTLVGEAGLGKSRLVAEIRKSAHLQSAHLQWVEGRCLSYASGIVYQLWIDMLHSLLGTAPDATAIDVRRRLREWVQALCPVCVDQVYPYLARMLSLPTDDEAEAQLRGLEAQGLKVLIFRAVETLIQLATQQRPLLIVCEDLHWADPTSLELLEYLLPLAERAPLLLVCVFRPEKEHGCWQIRETAARLYPQRHSDLLLDPLSEAESQELVHNLLRVQDLPSALRGRILERAEGNPFYVEEILRSLIDDGIVVHDEASGRWLVAAAESKASAVEIALPDTLQGVLRARIDRLPAQTKRVLQAASVIGRIFSYRLLSAIESPLQPPHPAEEPTSRVQTPLSPEGKEPRVRAHTPLSLEGKEPEVRLHTPPSPEGKEPEVRAYTPLSPEGEGPGVRVQTLDAHLLILQRAQMIRERTQTPERQYAFKHNLTVEAAYGGLLRRERRLYHRRVAEALEQLYPERIEEQLGRLAFHWEGAGETERAAGYLERAGAQAASQFANAEATAYLTRALDLTPDGNLPGYFRRLLAREAVYHLLGARSSQRADLLALKELARALDDGGRAAARRRAEVALHEAKYLESTGDQASAIAAAEEAIRLAQAAQDTAVEAASRLLRGTASRDDETAVTELEHALALARAAQDRVVEAESLRQLGLVSRGRGEHDRSIAYHERSLRIYRDIGNRMGEGRALNALGDVYLTLYDQARARRYSEQGLQLCRETGNRWDEAFGLFQLGQVSRHEGDYAGALAHFEQALRIMREIGAQEAEHNILAWMGIAYHRLGDYDRALELYESALRSPYAAGDAQAWVLAEKGLLLHDMGDDVLARGYCEQVLAMIDADNQADREWKRIYLGHVMASLGHLAEAQEIYRESFSLFKELGHYHQSIASLSGLAHVTLAGGRPVQALAYAEDVLSYLDVYPALDATGELFREYLTCYRVLRANEDPRAPEVLSRAYHLLQERAHKIEDRDLRRSYLETVATNREIVREFTTRDRGIDPRG